MYLTHSLQMSTGTVIMVCVVLHGPRGTVSEPDRTQHLKTAATYIPCMLSS